jgi:antimicrobial peptide system SdpA family protein
MGSGSAASVTGACDSEPLSRQSAESDIRLGRRLGVALVGAGCLIVAVLYAALPGTPFDLLPANAKQVVVGVVPEGWAFFTRSPRLPTAVAYQHGGDGRWHSLAAAPLGRLGDVMGLDRQGRARDTELATLTDQVPGSAWQHCTGDPLACLSKAPVAATVINTSHRRTCGDIGIVDQDVLPWAYRNSATVMPSRIVRVQVTC